MQSNSFSFSLKIWVTSVIIGPILFGLVQWLKGNHLWISEGAPVLEQLYSYFLFVIFGGFFSIITWILFFLILKIITLYLYQVDIIKIIIAVLGMLLTFGTFAVFVPTQVNPNSEFFYLMLSYAASIGVGPWFYKLEIMYVSDTS
ncbi:MAG: hypothetical protein V4520_01255 [Bacteroidota bacterium]